ncbi:caspase-2-like [Pecten maximus]|uniref:caspase-2-like n=1 Tax=Pecten maximus TaxID=6579 RepID=UPI001458ECFF|nr:caspase-2-like [Pecten maximus]
MDEVDRRKLTSNRSYLVKNIYKTMNVVDKLMEDRIITDGMKQDIEAERTNDDRNRRLLDIIPRRGPQAFEAFLNALVNTDNDFAAEQLSPGAGSIYKVSMTSSEKGMVSPEEEKPQNQHSEIILPKKWPTEQDCVTDFIVKKCSHSEERKWQSDYYYKMRSKPRGRVLMFNNFVAVAHRVKEDGSWKEKLQMREGTEKDEQSLRRLFEQLHFDVEVKKDRKVEQMRSDIAEEKAHPFHKDADCFILVFLSHGSTEGIYGTDGNVLTTDEVKSSFNNKNFGSMTNKPKLIFIQACRGDKYDKGANVADNMAKDMSDARKSMSALNLNDPKLENVDEADSKVEKSPSNADMFIANATTQDNVSFRNTKFGSWFIQALVYILRNYACQTDLLDMLTLVNKLVSEGRALDRDRNISVAVSVFESTLRHKLHFFPGLTEVVTHSPQD